MSYKALNFCHEVGVEYFSNASMNVRFVCILYEHVEVVENNADLCHGCIAYCF